MKKSDRQNRSPRHIKLFIELLIAIFVIEALVMLLLHFFSEPLHLSVMAESFIDSATLLIFLFPMLCLVFYRPLVLESAKYKKALDAAQQLKTGYNVIVQTAMDSFWAIDADGRILDVNDAYCLQSGYSREELLKMSIADVEAAETPEDIAAHIKKIKEAGGGRFETRHRCKDGRIVDVEVSVNYLDIDGGRLFAFLRDATTRKQKEKELHEANFFNRVILQTIPFGMDVVDEEGNIMYLNPKLESIFGKEAIGRKCWELYRDDKRQCRDCPLCEQVIPGETSSIETDGVLGGRSFQISHTGMIYQGKKVILEIFNDITVRKQAENKLQMLSAAVEQTADIIVITDNKGAIRFVNPAFEKNTGYAKEEAIGETPRILKSGKHDKSFYERLWNTILSGEVFKSVLINKKKNGELYYSEKTITPIKDASGNITYFVSTDKDITERKRYEEELYRANRELMKLDRLKSDFIANVSHELRTPIAMIKEGVSQVAEGLHGELKREQGYFLNKTMDNINRLSRIVNSIIDVSNLEAGRIELKKEPLDIVDLAARVISIFRPQAKSKGLEIKASLPEHRVEISADKDKLVQVFSNLIENAVKFTDKGWIEVKITEKDNAVECSISDTGKGIFRENLPDIFDKFQQFDRDYGPGPKGTGLGLAIAKGIVELYQGRIWAESESGKGSRFSFWLPKR